MAENSGGLEKTEVLQPAGRINRFKDFTARLFRLQKKEEVSKITPQESLTAGQAYDLARRFSKVLNGEEENESFWSKESTKIRQIFENEDFTTPANMLLIPIVDKVETDDDRGLSSGTMRGLLFAADFLKDEGEYFTKRIGEELQSTVANDRLALEAVLSLAHINQGILSERLFANIKGNALEAYKKLMQEDFKGRTRVVANTKVVSMLMGLALEFGDERDKRFAESQLKTQLFEGGQTSGTDHNLVKILFRKDGSKRSAYVEKAKSDFLAGLGLNSELLGRAWNFHNSATPELTELSNLKVLAELQKFDSKAPAYLFNEMGVRNFDRFSPETWKQIYKDRDDKVKKWVLVIGARADYIGAFSSSKERENGVNKLVLELASKDYATRYIEVESLEDINERMGKIKKLLPTRADGLIIMSHGSESGNAILANPVTVERKGNFELTANDILLGKIATLKDVVKVGAPTVLDMCYGRALKDAFEKSTGSAAGSEYTISATEINPIFLADGSLSFATTATEFQPGRTVRSTL